MSGRISKGIEDAYKKIKESNLEILAEKRKQILEKIEKIGDEVKVLQENHDRGVSVDRFRVEFLQNELITLQKELSSIETSIKDEVEKGIDAQKNTLP